MHSTHDITKLSAEPILALRQLSISQQQHCLLQGLSFALYRGQSLALVGESGSGKTITALAMMRLLAASFDCRGEILYAGQNLLDASEARLQALRGKKMAMIFQDPMSALNPLHTVLRLLGDCLAYKRLNKSQLREAVLALLAEVGLPEAETLLSRLPHQLSGGQRQRLMIAIALAGEPEILIADEPTSALDLRLQQQILALLKTLQQQRQLALLLISHDLTLLQDFADQVLVLQHGQMLQYGSMAQVLAYPEHAYTQRLLSQDYGQPVACSYSQCLLKVTDLTVAYRSPSAMWWRGKQTVQALAPLSFALAQGEALGVMGESGSGKSSLALALARLIASQGQIQLDRLRLDQMSEKQLRPYRSEFQILFQDALGSLNPRLTVFASIGEGLSLTAYSTEQIQQQVARVMQQVQLSPALAQRYPSQLSGGQCQRVALARVLLRQPRLLILDEPTASLDRSTQCAILDLLRQLQTQLQLSYIVMSHDQHVLRALCHRIMVLDQGKLVELQSSEALFQQPQSDYTKALIATAPHPSQLQR